MMMILLCVDAGVALLETAVLQVCSALMDDLQYTQYQATLMDDLQYTQYQATLSGSMCVCV